MIDVKMKNAAGWQDHSLPLNSWSEFLDMRASVAEVIRKAEAEDRRKRQLSPGLHATLADQVIPVHIKNFDKLVLRIALTCRARDIRLV